MGMFDTVSGALDTASQLLAGGTNNAAPAADDATAPPYLRGENLDVEDADDAGARAPNLVNSHNAYPVIEFIHFGVVHTSHSNLFVHDSYKDDEKEDKVQDGDRPRGLQFRSALEREAILLSTFMECTQTVLQERDSSGGGVGAALNTLGSMLGASGGGSGQTTAGDVNSHVQKVVSAAAPILPETITYTNTHQAGMDFHQARRNYRALLQKIVDEKPKADPLGGLMGSLPGMGGVAGTFAGIVSFTQGVAFKPQDVKVKFFALAAQQTEPQIEMASNAMTLKAIKELANPFLPVWTRSGPAKGTPTWDDAPANPLGGDHGNLLNPFLDPVVRATDTLRDDVVDQGNKVKAFFEHPPDDPPPGTDALETAFKNPPDLGGKDKRIVPMAMGDVACQAFLKALGLKPPLGIPETVVSAVVGLALEFTQAAYKSILVRDSGDPITHEAVLQSAREDLQIGKRLEGLAVAHLSFLKSAKDWQTPKVAGFQTKPGDLIDKGVGDVDALISDKLRPVMDPAVEYATGVLADQLELARQNGVNNQCHTMEWYLGRLPWVQATLFCNLFFPFWNALMRCATGILDAGTGSMLAGILNAADKVKGVVDTGRDAIAKGTALAQAASDTMGDFAAVDQNTDFKKKFGDAGGRFNDAANKKAKQTTGPVLDQGKFVIPVTGRSETGTGQAITKDEFDAVTPNHQWDGADDPDKKADAAKDAPPAAAGGDAGTTN